MTDIDVTQYPTHESIPNASVMKRFHELMTAACEKGREPELITDQEWHALLIISPDTAKRLHCTLREQQDHQQQLQQKRAPSTPAVQIGRMRKNEEPQSYFERCSSMAAPLYVVHAVWKSLGELVGFVGDMNQKNIERNEKIAALTASNAELTARVIALEASNAALTASNAELRKTIESKPTGLRYRGVWDPNREYVPDDGVTDGGLWVCLRTTRSRPSDMEDSRSRSAWQLALPRGKQGAAGRDGRDLR